METTPALALVANVSLIKLLKMLLRKRGIEMTHGKYDETYPAGMNGNRSYVEDNFGDTNRDAKTAE